jgi:hypothetical protein
MSRKAILVAIGGLAVIGAIVAAVLVGGDESSESPASSSERVSIEFRANPTATIYIDGKKRGTTPMRLQYPKGTRQVVVKAEMTRHLVGRRGSKDVLYEDVRTITLDKNHLLDFTLKTAKRVGTVVPGEELELAPDKTTPLEPKP